MKLCTYNMRWTNNNWGLFWKFEKHIMIIIQNYGFRDKYWNRSRAELQMRLGLQMVNDSHRPRLQGGWMGKVKVKVAVITW